MNGIDVLRPGNMELVWTTNCEGLFEDDRDKNKESWDGDRLCLF